VQALTQAQLDFKHWDKKVKEENEKLKTVKDDVAVCEVEFQVILPHSRS
jgi:hypothetical protein